MTDPLPPLRITAGNPVLGDDEFQAVAAVMRSGWLTQGPRVAEFEREFAQYVGSRYAVAVSSGTAALHLALLALGIGPGDEVIVPACTFVATINAVTYTGATPVIVDVDPSSWCLDLAQVRQALTPKTRAVIPVHLYGVPVNLERLRGVVGERVAIVEDAAEALGATYGGQHVGTWGDLGTFSFYGNKTITTGEGGMVVTDSSALAERLLLLRGQGQTPGRTYHHSVVGFNYRMGELQAAIGCAQLERIDDLLAARHHVAAWYRKHLGRCAILQELSCSFSGHGNWAIAGTTKVPAEKVRQALRVKGIDSRPVFHPLHQLPMYRNAVYRPVATDLHEYGVVFPTHPHISEADVEEIAKVVRGVCRDG